MSSTTECRIEKIIRELGFVCYARTIEAGTTQLVRLAEHGLGQNPLRICRLKTAVRDGQHVAALAEKALPGTERGPWVKRQIGDQVLRVLQHVEHVNAYEEPAHVLEGMS